VLLTFLCMSKTCLAAITRSRAPQAAPPPHRPTPPSFLQDMACDTFLKICSKCRRKFVVLQPAEREPFIAELLGGLADIIADLQPNQVLVADFARAVLCAPIVAGRALCDALDEEHE
jgi:hypothetical protein